MTEKKNVLLVDDDPDFVEAVKEEKPDIIVLDVMMPVMDGHAACAALKTDPETKDIPIILLTAVADRVTTSKYSHRDMLESEAEDYMPKPVDPPELLSLIRRWLL